MTNMLAIGAVALLVSVVLLGYSLLKPELAGLRSERLRAAEVGVGTAPESSTPVYDLIDRALKTVGIRPFSEEELDLAGIKSSVTSVVAVTLLVAFLAFVGALVLTGSLFFAIAFMIAAPVVVKVYVGIRTSRRRQAFDQQMAEAMTLLSSALKSGMNVPNALGSVAVEMDAPMGEEIARVVNETRLGRDLIECMKATSVRMESDDFLWITEAVAIQRESGGRLTEILDRVNETIAERNEMRLKIKALSAEGNASAVILMSLPVGIALFFLLINREFMLPLFTTGAGRILLAIAAVFYTIGGLWLRSITKVRF